jgi:glycosyltransferase involved in cell wall biosynthesis
VIGFLGRIVRDKGLIELAQAWQILRKEYENIHLLIVGQFEPQDPLPAGTEASLKSDPTIHFAGFVDKVVDLYQAMDILVLPTYREGFPVVPLEAAAMELPVVATCIPGCVEAVENGVTGVLVPPYDAMALAGAMRTYINNPDLRIHHGQSGRDRVIRNFQPELIWEATYEEYRRLLQSKNIGSPWIIDHEVQHLSSNS